MRKTLCFLRGTIVIYAIEGQNRQNQCSRGLGPVGTSSALGKRSAGMPAWQQRTR